MSVISFDNLCEKQVISCRDGKILGYPCDLKIRCGKTADECRLVSIIVGDGTKLFGGRKNVAEVFWDKIVKIGQDTILVDGDVFFRCDDNCNPTDTKCKKDKKSVFGG